MKIPKLGFCQQTIRMGSEEQSEKFREKPSQPQSKAIGEQVRRARSRNGEDEGLARLCFQDTTSKHLWTQTLNRAGPPRGWGWNGVDGGFGEWGMSQASGRCPQDPTWRALAGLSRGPRPG